MSDLTIFNIQKFSMHDGPGLRTTVFFKGCPLQCAWCHNPESQAGRPELLFDSSKCSGCGRCLPACPAQAARLAEGLATVARAACLACGSCAEACLCGARAVAGRTVTVAELLGELVKDRVFYEQSGGGITFSGGEALTQADGLAALAGAAKAAGLHVAVDTCGHVPFASFERLLPFTDLFLYDLKHMDGAAHRQLTGQDNALILANLRRLAAAGATVALRLPLIDGVNSDDANIAAVATFIRDIPLSQINLLPYHSIGTGKYARLGRAAADFAPPSEERLAAIAARLAAVGRPVIIGG